LAECERKAALLTKKHDNDFGKGRKGHKRWCSAACFLVLHLTLLCVFSKHSCRIELQAHTRCAPHVYVARYSESTQLTTHYKIPKAV
jgi:hypothetical protein